MKLVLGAALALLCAACSALPSMKYCDQVEYKRVGTKIHVQAECTAPVGAGLPGL